MFYPFNAENQAGKLHRNFVIIEVTLNTRPQGSSRWESLYLDLLILNFNGFCICNVCLFDLSGESIWELLGFSWIQSEFMMQTILCFFSSWNDFENCTESALMSLNILTFYVLYDHWHSDVWKQGLVTIDIVGGLIVRHFPADIGKNGKIMSKALRFLICWTSSVESWVMFVIQKLCNLRSFCAADSMQSEDSRQYRYAIWGQQTV